VEGVLSVNAGRLSIGEHGSPAWKTNDNQAIKCRHAHVLEYALNIAHGCVFTQQYHSGGSASHAQFLLYNVDVNLPNRAVTNARNTVVFLYNQ
jgi:hypothetical protein